MKTIELLRHTANDGDVLTPDGVAAAVEIGRGLTGDMTLPCRPGRNEPRKRSPAYSPV